MYETLGHFLYLFYFYLPVSSSSSYIRRPCHIMVFLLSNPQNTKSARTGSDAQFFSYPTFSSPTTYCYNTQTVAFNYNVDCVCNYSFNLGIVGATTL